MLLGGFLEALETMIAEAAHRTGIPSVLSQSEDRAVREHGLYVFGAVFGVPCEKLK